MSPLLVQSIPYPDWLQGREPSANPREPGRAISSGGASVMFAFSVSLSQWLVYLRYDGFGEEATYLIADRGSAW